MTTFKTETLNLGGGTEAEMIHMEGGEVVVYNDECVCIYKSEADFWANIDGQDVDYKFFWIKRESKA